MPILPYFEDFTTFENLPYHMQHILVSDGQYYHSGYWIEDLKGHGIFIQDDDAIQIIYWAPIYDDL